MTAYGRHSHDKPPVDGVTDTRLAKSHMVNNGCCTATRSCAGTVKKSSQLRAMPTSILKCVWNPRRQGKRNSQWHQFLHTGARRNIVAQLANNPAFNQQILLACPSALTTVPFLINTRIANSKTLRRTGGE